MTTRRGFLGAMLGLAAAPAVACLPTKSEPTLVIIDESWSLPMWGEVGMWDGDLPPRHPNCRSLTQAEFERAMRAMW